MRGPDIRERGVRRGAVVQPSYINKNKEGDAEELKNGVGGEKAWYSRRRESASKGTGGCKRASAGYSSVERKWYKRPKIERSKRKDHDTNWK